MNLFQRILLTLYSLSLAALSIIVLLVSLNIIRDEDVYYIIDSMYSSWSISLLVAFIAVVIFVLSLLFLSTAFRRGQRAHGVHQVGDHGNIIITIDTLESIASKAARRVKGIKDLKARVRAGESESGVRIGLRITVDGETSIPEITELLQQTVKAHTEEIAGVSVESVTVVVENTIQSTPSRGRVE